MSFRYLLICQTSITVLLAGLLAQAGARPPCSRANGTCGNEGQGALVQRVYEVADLIVPLESSPNSCVVDIPRGTVKPATQVVQPAPIGQPVLQAVYQEAPKTEPGTSPACTPSRECTRTGGSYCGRGTPPVTIENKLMKLITSTVRADSWDEMGGPGTIEYYPVGMALVVNQTAEVQEQVAELLGSLRRLQNMEVAVEMRLVSMPDAMMERLGLVGNQQQQPVQTTRVVIDGIERVGVDFNQSRHDVECIAGAIAASRASQVLYLSDIQLFLFMEAIQVDPRCNIMLAPKITMFNGQASSLRITDQQYYMTGVDMARHGDQVQATPRNEALTTGTVFSIQPVVSADRRTIKVKVNANLTSLASTAVPLFPVTTFVTPVFEGGAQGQPVPFTQFVQQPAFNTLALERTVKIADGGTAVFYGLKRQKETRTESCIPVLSRIPYVSRMFKNVSYGEETENLVLMVTPRIIINEDEESKSTTVAPCNPNDAAEIKQVGSSCPYVNQKAAQPTPPAVTAPALGSVMDNLQKLELAEKKYRQAEQYRRRGDDDKACRAYEELQKLCPGSHYDQVAVSQLNRLHARAEEKKHETTIEEQEISGAPAKAKGCPSCKGCKDNCKDCCKDNCKDCCKDKACRKDNCKECCKDKACKECCKDKACKECCKDKACKDNTCNECKVAELLEKYHQACSEGKNSLATKLAVQALALDPACFDRNQD